MPSNENLLLSDYICMLLCNLCIHVMKVADWQCCAHSELLCACRAYVLYLKSAGLESKVGPSIRVVDAATGYEELAKSLKQASPAKAARGARERPGPGMAIPAQVQTAMKATARASESGADAGWPKSQPHFGF